MSPDLEPEAVLATDDGEQAAGLGGPGITFVLCLIIEPALMNDQGPTNASGSDFILLSLPDLAAILKPANLHKDKPPRDDDPRAASERSVQQQESSPWPTLAKLRIRTWRLLSL